MPKWLSISPTVCRNNADRAGGQGSARRLKDGALMNGAQAPVGLSMMCYTLGKENKTCLGERQLRGRIGKLL